LFQLCETVSVKVLGRALAGKLNIRLPLPPSL